MAEVKRRKIPAMSSRKLIRLLERAGAVFDREGRGDHAIYKREVRGKARGEGIKEKQQGRGRPETGDRRPEMDDGRKGCQV